MDALWLAPSAVVLAGTPFVGRALARTRVEARRTTLAARALGRELDGAAADLGAAGRRLRVALHTFERRRGRLSPQG